MRRRQVFAMLAQQAAEVQAPAALPCAPAEPEKPRPKLKPGRPAGSKNKKRA